MTTTHRTPNVTELTIAAEWLEAKAAEGVDDAAELRRVAEWLKQQALERPKPRLRMGNW